MSQGNSADSWNISDVRLPLHRHGAGGRLVEAGDEVEQRALPAAGRADQAHELAGGHVERDPVERVGGVAGVAEHLGDGVEGDGGGLPSPSITGSSVCVCVIASHSPVTQSR